MYSRILIASLAAIAAPTTYAHHSFAPHFDTERQISVSGTIREFEPRNPHVFLHIEVIGDDGQLQVYVCESNGISTLERNGINREMFVVGEEIQLEGVPARRDPQRCFFRSVRFADGSVLAVSGSESAREETVLPRRDSMFGTWFIVPAGRISSGPWKMINYMTPEGEQAVANYDPFLDDPTLRCNPVGIRRAWSAPSEPLQIRREGDDVIIHHEWMDTVRVINLGDRDTSAEMEPATLGHSYGHFEEDTLLIETENFTEGVLRQYVEEDGQPTRGLLHSDQLKVLERIRFDPESQILNVVITRNDPQFFSREFPVISIDFAPSNVDLQHFGCRPEV